MHMASLRALEVTTDEDFPESGSQGLPARPGAGGSYRALAAPAWMPDARRPRWLSARWISAMAVAGLLCTALLLRHAGTTPHSSVQGEMSQLAANTSARGSPATRATADTEDSTKKEVPAERQPPQPPSKIDLLIETIDALEDSASAIMDILDELPKNFTVCGNIVCPQNGTCCAAGNGGLCRAPEATCCAGTTHNGEICCDKDATCCNGICCAKGGTCCLDERGTGTCCLEGATCCNGICGRQGYICQNGVFKMEKEDKK